MKPNADIYYRTGEDAYVKTLGEIDETDGVSLTFCIDENTFCARYRKKRVTFSCSGSISYAVDFSDEDDKLPISTPYGTVGMIISEKNAVYQKKTNSHLFSLSYVLFDGEAERENTLTIRGKLL